MKPESQQIAIAKVCGTLQWDLSALPRKVLHCEVPDYLNNLNAMHEAENTLNQDDNKNWMNIIYAVTKPSLIGERHLDRAIAKEVAVARAKAAQRAEVFLRTKNLWTE